MQRAKGGYCYILTNKARKVLYTGVTNNLHRRIHEHKSGEGSVFTEKYNCHILVHFEFFDHIEGGIKREKQIKSWPRRWKENLINSKNPDWKDLSNDIADYQ